MIFDGGYLNVQNNFNTHDIINFLDNPKNKIHIQSGKLNLATAQDFSADMFDSNTYEVDGKITFNNNATINVNNELTLVGGTTANSIYVLGSENNSQVTLGAQALKLKDADVTIQRGYISLNAGGAATISGGHDLIFKATTDPAERAKLIVESGTWKSAAGTNISLIKGSLDIKSGASLDLSASTLKTTAVNGLVTNAGTLVVDKANLGTFEIALGYTGSDFMVGSDIVASTINNTAGVLTVSGLTANSVTRTQYDALQNEVLTDLGGIGGVVNFVGLTLDVVESIADIRNPFTSTPTKALNTGVMIEGDNVVIAKINAGDSTITGTGVNLTLTGQADGGTKQTTLSEGNATLLNSGNLSLGVTASPDENLFFDGNISVGYGSTLKVEHADVYMGADTTVNQTVTLNDGAVLNVNNGANLHTKIANTSGESKFFSVTTLNNEETLNTAKILVGTAETGGTESSLTIYGDFTADAKAFSATEAAGRIAVGSAMSCALAAVVSTVYT